MQELRVKPSDVPGEQLATTQILPTLPPPFTRQKFTEDMVTDRTPAARKAALKEWRSYRSAGEYDPPSLQGTILYPGMDGGGEWGGVAFDAASGLLYVNARAQQHIHPSIISAYPGAIGVSRSMEAIGQRDEPAIIGFGEAMVFQEKIGPSHIEARSRALAQALIAGLRRIDGVRLWTSPDPALSAAVVTFQPGALDIPKLAAALYRNDGIGCATRTGTDRPGIRFSPHIYNTMAEADRAVAAVAKYMKQGV